MGLPPWFNLKPDDNNAMCTVYINIVCTLLCLIVVCQFYLSKISNIRRTLVGNKIVDHSNVVGASPVGDAPTTSSFST